MMIEECEEMNGGASPDFIARVDTLSISEHFMDDYFSNQDRDVSLNQNLKMESLISQPTHNSPIQEAHNSVEGESDENMSN